MAGRLELFDLPEAEVGQPIGVRRFGRPLGIRGHDVHAPVGQPLRDRRQAARGRGGRFGGNRSA